MKKKERQEKKKKFKRRKKNCENFSFSCEQKRKWEKGKNDFFFVPFH